LEADHAIEMMVDAFFLVEVNEGLGLGIVVFQPDLEGFGIVVFALDKLRAATVADALHLRLHGVHVVGSAALGADPPAGDTLHKHFVGDGDVDDEGDGTLLDVIPDTSTEEADAALGRESLRSDLEDVMRILAPRERDILLRAYGIGCPEKTLEEIGDEFSLTRERVRQIKEKAIRKMARKSVRERLVQYR
jgi:RNA polymerase sigma factor (sigma-70 family)